MYHRSFPPLPEAQAAVAPPRPPSAAPRRVLLAADLQHRLKVLAARRAVSAGARSPAVAPGPDAAPPPEAALSGSMLPEPGASAEAALPGPAGPRRVTEPPRPRAATVASLPPTALPGPAPLLLTGARHAPARPWDEALCGDTFDFDLAGLRRG